MPVLSKEQVASLWVEAGGPPQQAAMAAEVSTHESGRDTDVVNSIGATGLMQIYDGHYPSKARIKQLQNPRQNMKEAVAKFKAAGGRWGPNPWQVCSDAQCSNLATGAAQFEQVLFKIPHWKGLFPDVPGMPGGPGSLLPDPGEQGNSNPLNVLGDLKSVANSILEVGNALGGIVTFLAEWSRKIADPQTWLDAGKIFLGIIFLYMGVKRMFTIST